MPNYSTNLKTWGSTGQEPPDNYSYVEGEQPVDAWDNWFASNVVNDIESLISTTNNDLVAKTGDTMSGQLTINSDLRLATGQSIEDGGGSKRVEFTSTRTKLYNDGDEWAIRLIDNTSHEIGAGANEPFRIHDKEGGFTAVEYTTDPNSGTLNLENAGLAVQGSLPSLKDPALNFQHTGSEAFISNRVNSGTKSEIKFDDGFIDLSNQAQDLRLATGQSIEDGGGDERVKINSDSTSLAFGGHTGFASQDDEITVVTNATHPFVVYDGNQGAAGFQYNASSAGGTLELINSDLDAGGNDITNAGSISTGDVNVTGSGQVSLVGYADSAGVSEVEMQETASVSTSATTIVSNINRVVDVLVFGQADGGSGDGYFMDRVTCTRAGSPTVQYSETENTPASRSYSRSSASLQLGMGSDTYGVSTVIQRMFR